MTIKKAVAKTKSKPRMKATPKAKAKPKLKLKLRAKLKPRVRTKDGSGALSSWVAWVWSVIGGALVIGLLLWRADHAKGPSSEAEEERSTPPPPAVSQLEQAPAATTERAASPLAEAFASAGRIAAPGRVAYWSEWLTRPGTAWDEFRAAGSSARVADSAPLIPARFDCTTYVETVIALSRSRTPEDFYARLIEVRYHGSSPSFFTRNHFPEAEWIPGNVHRGILADLTEEVARAAGVELRTQTKVIERARWFARRPETRAADRALASIGSPSRDIGPGRVQATVRYVAIGDLERVLGSIPDGAVINVVRRNEPQRPVMISHQGFLVRAADGETYFRHASVGGELRTVPFLAYFRGMARPENAGPWPIVGVNVNGVAE